MASTGSWTHSTTKIVSGMTNATEGMMIMNISHIPSRRKASRGEKAHT
jgi:hypothetical protein